MYEWNDGTSYLVHHGTKGQKWGVRRFQNPDGTLTEEGKRKLQAYRDSEASKAAKRYDKMLQKNARIASRLQNSKRRASDDLNAKRVDVINSKIKLNSLKRKGIEKMKASEMKAIASMSYESMQKEKKAVKKAGAHAVAMTAATMLLFGAVGSPVSVLYHPNAQKIKTEVRLRGV